MNRKQSTRYHRFVLTMLLIVGVEMLTHESAWFGLIGGGMLGLFTYEVSP